MYLREILAISGTPGLYKYVAQGKGGIIVEALVGGKRAMVSGSSKVSALGDIAVFTQDQEVPLSKVLQGVFDAEKGKTINLTSNTTPQELATFMVKALPNYDQQRVHNSDIKKMIQWYNILVEAGMTDFLAEETEPQATTSDAETTPASHEATAKKTTAPKTPKKPAPAKVAAPKATGAAASRPKVAATKSTTNRKSGS